MGLGWEGGGVTTSKVLGPVVSLGDHNSTFFPHSVRGRVVRNDLASLIDVTCQVIMDHSEIAHLTVDFYRNLLGSKTVGFRDLTDPLAWILEFLWPLECCADLCCPMTHLEVIEVLFYINSRKDPCSDGFLMGFFKVA